MLEQKSNIFAYSKNTNYLFIFGILSIFFIGSIVQPLSIKLQPTNIYSRVKAHPIDEILYTTKIYLNEKGDYIVSVFDINSSSTWIIDNTCENCYQYGIETNNIANQECIITGKGQNILQGFAGEVLFLRQLSSGYTYNTANTNLYIKTNQGQKKFKTEAWLPYQLASPQTEEEESKEECDQCSKTALLKHAQLGIGLGPFLYGYSPFMEIVNKTQKIQDSKISFYMNADSNYMQLDIGVPQGYFKLGEWQYIKNSRKQHQDSVSLQSYTMICISISIGDHMPVKLQSVNPDTRLNHQQLGVFTSTSKYIYFGHIHIAEKIVERINTYANAHCHQSFPHNIYVCDKKIPIENFPNLTWTFEDLEGTRKEMVLEPKNYVEYLVVDGVEKLVLLLRPGKFELQQSSTYNLALPNIWLGYPFFKQYYISFDYQEDQIQFAPRYQINNERLVLYGNFRFIILLFGCILALIMLAMLFKLLKNVPKGSGNIAQQHKNSEYFNNTYIIQNNAPILLVPSQQILVTSQHQLDSPVRQQQQLQGYQPQQQQSYSKQQLSNVNLDYNQRNPSNSQLFTPQRMQQQQQYQGQLFS